MLERWRGMFSAKRLWMGEVVRLLSNYIYVYLCSTYLVNGVHVVGYAWDCGNGGHVVGYARTNGCPPLRLMESARAMCKTG